MLPAPPPPPPPPQWFSLQKGQIAGATPPPELPEKGVRSPLTPPQGNTVYRLPKNATLCVGLPSGVVRALATPGIHQQRTATLQSVCRYTTSPFPTDSALQGSAGSPAGVDTPKVGGCAYVASRTKCTGVGLVDCCGSWCDPTMTAGLHQWLSKLGKYTHCLYHGSPLAVMAMCCLQSCSDTLTVSQGCCRAT